MHINLRILKALLIKETLQIFRDPSTILIAFILPLILLFIFGYGVNLDSNVIKIGIVLEQEDTPSLTLSETLAHSKFLDATFARDKHQFSKEIVASQLRGMIVIPQNFSKKLNDLASSPSIQVITDGSEPNIAAFVSNYATGSIINWAYEQGLMGSPRFKFQPLIQLEPRYWYNPELKSRNFLVPGSIAIVMTLIGTLLTALVIAREWERGTMEALLATPVTIYEIILGKLIPYFILGLGSMLLCTFIATFLYNVPLRGSIVALSLVSAFFLFAALGQGLFISTIAKDQFIASQAALMSAFLPAFMLSGFIFEISAMPAPIRWLTHILSARYFVSSLQTIFLVGNIWPLISRCIFFILIIGTVFFMLTLHKTRKRLD